MAVSFAVTRRVHMWKKLKDDSGFSIIELMSVMLVIGVLAQLTTLFVFDIWSRSYDLSAFSDGRNFVTVVRDNFVARADVDYTHNPGDGPYIGAVDTGGGAREPVFKLSPGVEATINGDSNPTNPLGGFVTATVYHNTGTEEGGGRREFTFIIDESGNDVLATFY
jgi:prepilin-type N-terminal cleavage/methylation domain-containing protein